MAKYNNIFKGDFDHFQEELLRKMESKSRTFKLEDVIRSEINHVDSVVYRVERYSMFARYVNIHITLLHHKNIIEIIAVTSSGYTEAYINEENFLNTLIESVEEYLDENKFVD